MGWRPGSAKHLARDAWGAHSAALIGMSDRSASTRCSTPRPGPEPVRVLLTGWPSFLHGEATAGDVLSMQRVHAALQAAGVACELAWSPVFRPGALTLDDAVPQRYTHVVFACGPVHGQQLGRAAAHAGAHDRAARPGAHRGGGQRVERRHRRCRRGELPAGDAGARRGQPGLAGAQPGGARGPDPVPHCPPQHRRPSLVRPGARRRLEDGISRGAGCRAPASTSRTSGPGGTSASIGS